MSKKCTDVKSIYEDISFCRGQKALPGVRPYVYGISKRDIVLWPKMPATPASLDAAAKYAGSFELAAEKKWHKVGLIHNQGQLTYETQGSWPSVTFLNTLKVLMPGTGITATGYANEVINDDMVYLAVMPDGKIRVIGNEYYTTEVKPSGDTGTSATDTNATTLTITVTDPCAAPFYEGVIETEDGDIDASTGETAKEEKTQG